MFRYQILIEYVGTNFRGWQVQKKGKTIQGLIQQKISKIAIAVGACSEVATRLNDLEQHLCGQPLVGAADILSPSHFAGLSPIDDVRAPASYRIDAVEESVRRLIAKAGSDIGHAK